MLKRTTIGILLAVASDQAIAGDCSAPPVVSREDAICLARQFAEWQEASAFQLEYVATEHTYYWLVYYGPTPDSGVRGGGAEVKVDKETGEVAWVRGYR